MDPISESLEHAISSASFELSSIDEKLAGLMSQVDNLHEKRAHLIELLETLHHQLHRHNHWAEAERLEDHGSTYSFLKSTLSLPVENDDRMSLKEMILQTLFQLSSGAEIQKIIAYLNALFGVDMSRSSVSPALSRLKQDGFVQLENNQWSLTRKGRNQLFHFRP